MVAASPSGICSSNQPKMERLKSGSAAQMKDIRNTNTIKFVMKNGELFEGDTLNQVWPQQKSLPRMWWWDEPPSVYFK